jgi:carboxypeptidase C (cathepsin A)
VLDLQQMPLLSQQVRNNLSARFYPSGHMVYLDGGSRTALKVDLAAMYEKAVSNTEALGRVRALQALTAAKMH